MSPKRECKVTNKNQHKDTEIQRFFDFLLF